MNLLIGQMIVTDYGESWDEQLRYRYAERSLDAYQGKTSDLTDEKGPFYVMVAFLGAKALNNLWTSWQFINGWHFMNFLTFLMGLFFFYKICRRLVKPGPAMGATLLFSTQPLLWGHAFINPKDIPFMSFFLGSVTLGLEMVDTYNRQAAKSDQIDMNSGMAVFRQQFIKDWKDASQRKRRLFSLMGLLWLGLVLGHYPILKGIAWIVGQAYKAGPSSWLGSLFERLAQNAGQVSKVAYIHKSQTLYTQLALPGIAVLLLVNLFLASRVFPTVTGWLRNSQNRSSLKQWIGSLILPRVVLAGIFLGFCSAIRVLGPASGLLVGAYFLIKARRKALPIVLLYLGIGAMVTYLAWPALWSAPIRNYLGSSAQALNFPWEGNVTFAGSQYNVDALPRTYLPTLLGLQFTEPALVLMISGAILAVIQAVRNPGNRLDLLLLGIWLLAPIGEAVVFRPTLYDNFRQFLFTVPPLFILASLSLQSLAERLKRGSVFGLVVLLLVLPGLYWIFQLHPYQYIYYNSLVGGPQGAFRRFELDYWATSYKEAAEYLNQVAPLNARVVVQGPFKIVKNYARQDLKIFKYPKPGEPELPVPPDFAILSTRNNEDLTIFPQASVIHRVSSAGAPLAVIKQLQPAQIEAP